MARSNGKYGQSGEALLSYCAAAVTASDALLLAATRAVRSRVTVDGRLSAAQIDREQRAVHGLAWFATYVQAVRELSDFAHRLTEDGRFGEIEEAITDIAVSECLAQMAGGIAMSQGEFVRLADLGMRSDHFGDAFSDCITGGNSVGRRARLAELMAATDDVNRFCDDGLDETMHAMRAEIGKFARAKIKPFAQAWHSGNEYIPLDVIDGLAEIGVFGLTIPENYGGIGLGKTAMCVVSEELSQAYIGVGSLGTRSEIAAELILGGGTEGQKRAYLPRIASGKCLPTAVFTEPNTGSDLAALTTRAKREGNIYRITGNKTWITHPVRADLMTVLARTDPNETGYKGLSMFLADKPRGSDTDPFPVKGLSGSEIGVLGYRGMKEFELAFDGFEVAAENLLGGLEGQGFKQLMQTFESARIQTAARAVGVAQSALELGLAYGRERRQFGQTLVNFPRVADKLVMMAVEIHIARQLTYFAGRAKDAGRRCDVEAGMAKLLAARVAWAAADNALQIHGGNGFALEYPISRVLCDARILNIFEGAAEIQAHVIGRRLLEGAN
jgi:(2S)-methylsuccinyl-CoA dehydrogenase